MTIAKRLLIIGPVPFINKTWGGLGSPKLPLHRGSETDLLKDLLEGCLQDRQVITAAKGEFDYFYKPMFHRLKLTDARILKKVQEGTDLSGEFGSFSLFLPAETPKPPKYKVKSASTNSLRQSSDPVARAEFQWRMSTPVSALLLALAAIPLSRSRPRQGRYAKMLMALGIYAIYFNLLDVSRSWVEQGSSAYIWWVPGLLSLVVAALYAPAMLTTKKDNRAQN